MKPEKLIKIYQASKKNLLNIYNFIGVFMSVLSISSCQTTPMSGQQAFILTSESFEIDQGEQAYRQILAKEKIEYGTERSQMINEIGLRIAQASQKTDYLWEFKALQNESPNAFCLPGGKVAVYTGIIKYAKNEAGMAAVIGHEVGHAIARHGGQRMSQQIVTAIAMETLQTKAFGNMSEQEKQITLLALGVGTTIGVTLPFSRSHETEADEIGLILMARAGFDPREAIEFWDRFSQTNNNTIEFLSTHPKSENRRDHLRKFLPKAIKIYEQSARLGIGRIF